MKTFLVCVVMLLATSAHAGDLTFNKTISSGSFVSFLTHLEADTGLKFRGTCVNQPNPSCVINGWVSYSRGIVIIHIHESADAEDPRIEATEFNQNTIDSVTASVGSF